MSEGAVEGKLHWLTPVRRTWTVMAGIILFFVRELHLLVVEVWQRSWWGALLGTLVLGLVVAWFARKSANATWYRLTATTLDYRAGLLFRSKVHLDLAHVQEVEVYRPLIGRVFKVCELRIEQPGSQVSMALLSLEQGELLKRLVLERAQAKVSGKVSLVREERPVAQVGAARLALAMLLDARNLAWAVGALLLGLVPYLVSGDPWALVSQIAPISWAWRITGKAYFKQYGWRLTSAGGSFRSDYGMFDRRHNTIKRDRVQVVELHQPVLWRRYDWVRVQVAVPGVEKPQLLMPVCSRALGEKLIGQLLGVGAVVVLDKRVAAGREARRVTLWWRALGYYQDDDWLASWRGVFLRNEVSLCRMGSVRTVSVFQWPWERWCGLASLEVDTSGGKRSLAAMHLPVGRATELLASVRLRISRNA